MNNDLFTGRGIRAPERSRMLVATEDGVFLWPGLALVYRRGNGFCAIDPREVNNLIGSLFGPEAIYTPIQSVLELARERLRAGQTAVVQQVLDGLRLRRVSPNGARLMRTVAARQGLALPDVAVATEQSGTVWTDRDVDLFLPLYDRVSDQAHRLAKIFNPGSAWDPSKHPRQPSGQSDGGEFSPADGDEGNSASPIHPVAATREFFLEKPPKIPTEEPTSETAKNAVRKEVGWWLLQAVAVGGDIVAPEFAAVHAAVQGVAWLAPYVNSYLDPLKTLEELQDAVNSPRVGYNIHHIAEQTAAEKDGYPRSQIDDPSNLALIPTLKHWELTAWSMIPNKKYGGLTPREYSCGKDWGTRLQVGRDGLIAVGVLKK